MNKEKLGIICAVVCEILFGFSFLFTKKITATVSPMTLLSWRFILAFLLINICVLTRVIKVSFKNKPVLPLFLVALFQPVLYFMGETIGIKLTSASESGTFIACIPIITLLFSALILKERPGKLQAIGIFITVAGILVSVLMKGLDATLNLVGYVMLLAAVTAGSLYSVFSQKAAEYTSAEKTYAMMGLGAIVFTAIAAVQHGASGTFRDYLILPFTNADFLTSVLYLSAGCSVVAFLLYNKAIEAIGTNRAASFIGLSTVVTVTAGVIILREPYSVIQGLGTVLVIGGVYMANIRKRQKLSI